MHPITKQIIKALDQQDTRMAPDRIKWARKILVTDKHIRGLKIPLVGQVVKLVFKENKISKDLGFQVAEQLFAGPSYEDSIAGYKLLELFKNEFVPADLIFFKRLIKNYVNEWAHCDSFCINVIGPFLFKNQQIIPQLLTWSQDKKMWVRRASAVCTTKLMNLGWWDQKIVYTVAKRLINEPDNFIQKAVGWQLKVRGQTHPDEVIDFLLPYKNKVPRLVLRYAMEKVAADKKKRLLK